MNAKPAVTVCIPIHDAFEDTVACVESVLRRMTAEGHGLLLLDDGSTDARLRDWLDRTAAEVPGVRLERHERARGFVRTANHAIELAGTNDVVLLNSDTIVTDGWLTGLQSAAADHPDAASVTPLSNEASIFSLLPSDDWLRILAQRGIPGTGRLIRERSHRLRPAIPTGVGFCLYMRREAIDEVGTFDEAFGMGYGEENDWCMRAAKAGWRHLLDDATFVYHRGGASMDAAGHGKKKGTDHRADKLALLLSKHPHYQETIDAFTRADPLAPLRAHVRAVLRRRTVGFLLHKPIHGADFGGTERHVADLAMVLRKTDDVVTLHPEDGVLLAERFAGGIRERRTFACAPSRRWSLGWALGLAADWAGIDLLHVHHLDGMHPAALGAITDRGIPIIYSLHDVRFAGVHRAVLEQVERFVAPSATISDLLVRIDPALRERCVVVPHGHDAPVRRHTPSARGAVCFLGTVHTEEKGRSHTTAAALRLAERGRRVVLLGTQADRMPRALRGHPLITFRGFYDREDLPSLLAEEDVAVCCLPSTIPEGFGYTLSESWAAGVPAAVLAGSGALEERVSQTGAGLVSHARNGQRLADDLGAFLGSPAYGEALRATAAVTLPTTADAAAALSRLYDEVLEHAQPRDTRARRATKRLRDWWEVMGRPFPRLTRFVRHRLLRHVLPRARS